jgi:hypothetical protein
LDLNKISYKDTGRFNQLILDYLNQNKDLSEYISHFPNEENFIHQIKSKSSDFPNGVYFINANNQGNKIQQKFIKY